MTVDPNLLAEMRSNPGDFYANLHTTAFPDGAARAQLHRLSHPVATAGVAAVQESVLVGSQFYACTAQPGGSFAFTQLGVDARLTGGIHHTFVQPAAGPPQWQAPDGTRSPLPSTPPEPHAGAGNVTARPGHPGSPQDPAATSVWSSTS